MITKTKKRAKPWRDPLAMPRTGVYSFDDFCHMAPDGQKGDLIDGVIYVASPDSIRNADLQMWLAGYMYEFVQLYKLGSIFTSRVAYKLDETNAPEPDIGFVAKAWSQSIKTGQIEGPPTLAVEIVSPESVRRDYITKRALYERAGVLEYWIIDPDAQVATFLVRKGKRFVKGRLQKSIWHSQCLPGFTLDIHCLWQKERPRIFDLLRDHYYPQS